MSTHQYMVSTAAAPTMRSFLRPVLLSAVFFMLLTGIAYPLATTLIGTALFPEQAQRLLALRVADGHADTADGPLPSHATQAGAHAAAEVRHHRVRREQRQHRRGHSRPQRNAPDPRGKHGFIHARRLRGLPAQVELPQ